ncbi:acyltransferase family protein [Acidovorax sp. 94]|uniref:acyltransferase family protein n=1 Tax=Acidovorax sp. 94 TaxID=2135633 RepID=UPI0011C3F958|nr:acyltransferase family protein [Acidovorax sp. 94]
MSLDNKLEYRPDIDGLRAIAVLMVLAVHASPLTLPNGYVGVDLFFVISGYLITAILCRELAEGRFSIRDFYVRRVNRIFPALVLVLLLCMLIGPALMYPGEYGQMSKSALFSALFSANIHFYMESGYWDVASKLKPLLHLWSLGVEEQFYLVWPLILLWAHRTKCSMVSVALAVLFGSLVVNLLLTSKSQAAGFYLPFGRLWELASGGLIACIQWNRRQESGGGSNGEIQGLGVRNVMGWSGIALLAATQGASMNADAFPGFYAVAVVLAAALLILAGPDAWFNCKVLAHPALVYVGRLSYPLYLWHWPLLVFARLVGDGQWSSSHRNLAVAASVVLAVLTHHGVERPLVQRVGRKNLLALSLVLLMAVVTALAWMGSSGKIPLTAAPYPNAALVAYDKPEVKSQGRVALLGDSNAGHFSYGLSVLYGDRLDVTATPGWPYFDGVKYRDGHTRHPEHVGAPEMTEQVLRRIESDPEIRLVILSNVYRIYFVGNSLRSIQGAGPDETSTQAYERGLQRTVQRLLAGQKKVVLVKSIPTHSVLLNVTGCLDEVRPTWRRQPVECVRSRDAVEAERREYDAMVDRLIAGLQGVYVFNTLDELCDAQYCYINRDGVQMYIDSGHFTTAGSQIMGAALARKVEEALGR